MNGFLVVLVHTMDDLPVGLFATRQEAVEYADAHPEMPTEAELDVFPTDCSTPCNLSVVEFRGGMPVKIELIRLLDE